MEGGRFSKIRAGFEAVIQHDSPLTPEDCGGPLVNSDGELVGLNIARSSRIRSFALPWNLIEPVLHRTDDGSWALKKPRKDIEKQLARARREFERTENKIKELESLLSDLDSE
jgi:serine protease Do